VESSDVAAWLPDRPPDSHKYRAGVAVVAGSPGMMGAALLCSRAALRAGSGYVRLGSPGADLDFVPPGEYVVRNLPATRWADVVLADIDRYKALVVGPGLRRGRAMRETVRDLVSRAPLPTLVDGDGLVALGDVAEAGPVLGQRSRPTVLTPHEGEFGKLAGKPPDADRLGAVRALARDVGAVVLLKGWTTVVAEPGGRALFATAGDARLATAGTGDVLSGVIGAFLAMGLSGLRAAAAGAHVHGLAGHLGFPRGLVAGDLPDLLPVVLSNLE
jgi:NAD(P)H-hydrate epimerase